MVNGRYGRAMLATAEELVGPLGVAVVEASLREEPASLKQKVTAACTEVDAGQGILLVVDLCGSTLGNICFSQIKEHPDWESITGINLAMLLKLATCRRDSGARAMATELQGTAQRSVRIGSELLKKGESCGD